MTTTYGTLTASDLERNRDKLTKAWNPDNPIKNLWKNIKIIQAIATQGTEPIADGTTIQLTLLALGKTGVHSHAIETWFNKDKADHTGTNFQVHFNKHEKTWLNKMMAQADGFHGAQNATHTPDAQAIAAQALTTAAQQAGKPKDDYVGYTILLEANKLSMLDDGTSILTGRCNHSTGMWQIDLNTANPTHMSHHIGKQSIADVVAFAHATLFPLPSPLWRRP